MDNYNKVAAAKNIRLSNEMFNAVLAAGKRLPENYLDSENADIKSACDDGFSFYTFAASDGIHADEKASSNGKVVGFKRRHIFRRRIELRNAITFEHDGGRSKWLWA